jgi:hypothetical protein
MEWMHYFPFINKLFSLHSIKYSTYHIFKRKVVDLTEICIFCYIQVFVLWAISEQMKKLLFQLHVSRLYNLTDMSQNEMCLVMFRANFCLSITETITFYRSWKNQEEIVFTGMQEISIPLKKTGPSNQTEL